MILVINTGSSSLKFKLFGPDLREISSGSFDELKSTRDYKKSFNALSSGIKKFVGSEQPLQSICHRVVHGGNLTSPYLISDNKSIRKIERLSSLAPLHNPPALNIIKLSLKYFPKVKNTVVFDTGYFADLPELSKLIPINRNIASTLGYQKYGFHGISHRYVSNIVDPNKSLKLVCVHLGAGCSITAIKNGQPLETSMSYTPMDGLMMQTRSGALDPGVVLSLVRKFGAARSEDIIEKQSGLAGITETDGDMKNILYSAGYHVDDEKFNQSPPPRTTEDKSKLAKLAIDKYVYEIKKQIGAYYLILNGADVLVFTGRIGYNSSVIRDLITKDSDILKNIKIMTVAPDEELAMAMEIS